MNWYLTKIIYRIICGDGNHTAQFDEQLRLIEAEDELHALIKARQLGHKEEDAVLNKKQKPVLWKFIDVSEIHLLSGLNDGAEVYSNINEQVDADAFTKKTYLSAAHLMDNFSKSIF
jgi:hypothetical protein